MFMNAALRELIGVSLNTKVMSFVRVVTLCAYIFLCTGLSTSSQAQSGADLIKKMQAAYAGLKSYSQKTSATGKVTIQGNSKLNGMTAEFRYQAPNKAFVLVSSPSTGALACFSNGKEFTVYQSSENIFTKLTPVTDLPGFVKALAPFSIAATLDPLYFAEKLSLEKIANNWKVKSPTKINGINCQVVEGQLTQKLLIGGTYAKVTYWLDDQFFIRKMALEWKGVPIQVRPTNGAKGKAKGPTTVLMDRTITEVIQELKVNPNLSDADFIYPIPKNARENKNGPPKQN